jgi:hypothetical protein
MNTKKIVVAWESTTNCLPVASSKFDPRRNSKWRKAPLCCFCRRISDGHLPTLSLVFCSTTDRAHDEWKLYRFKSKSRSFASRYKMQLYISPAAPMVHRSMSRVGHSTPRPSIFGTSCFIKQNVGWRMVLFYEAVNREDIDNTRVKPFYCVTPFVDYLIDSFPKQYASLDDCQSF